MEAKAVLRNCPLSPRKMRLLADQIRGQRVEMALNILQWNQRPTYAIYLSKLVKSGIANWGVANADGRIEDSELYIKSITIDGGFTMKRLRTAPQGRGYRMRKRSNHVTLVIDSKVSQTETEQA
ncbi:MAG: 50S ribosomal protein L22 [Bacteroidia bacterium]|jgi:large subunit ribosomal protein L22|nr:50S ribosomal protein L22 [Bacteroidia bacterium]MDG1747584.1 50S ribosomal protein L22 [Bacteroidia bacterium]